MNKLHIAGKVLVGAILVSALGYLGVVSGLGLAGGCGQSPIDKVVVTDQGREIEQAEKMIESPVDSAPPATTEPVSKTGPGTFTHLITDLNALYYIIPVGEISPPGHVIPSNHMYLNFKDPTKKIDVYIPGDATIVAIRGSAWITPDGKPLEYMISFQYSDTFSYYLGHIRDLEPWLMSQVDDLRPDEWRELNIPVTAGTKLGKAGAVEGLYSFDWGIVDKQKEVSGFIHPENYNESTLYAESPLKYCIEEHKKDYLAVVAEKENPDKYGRVGWDVAGRLRGGWFSADLKPKGEHHLAIKENYADQQIAFVPFGRIPSRQAISLGRDLEIVGRYRVKEPKFEDVSVKSGLVIYDLYDLFYAIYNPGDYGQPQGRVLVQMLTDEKIKVEATNDPTATSFSEKAKIYTR